MPHIVFILILLILVIGFLAGETLDYLNLTTWKPQRPDPLMDYYTKAEYLRARAYHSEIHTLSLWSDFVATLVLILFLGAGGFGLTDGVVREITRSAIPLALLFLGGLAFLSDILSIPFEYRRIFYIEQKYGFNRMTLKTFVTDRLKGYMLGAIFGGILLSLVILFFEKLGRSSWLYAWIAVSAVIVFINLFYTSLILPLFNRLKPLEEGPLKSAIDDYARKVDFPLRGIFVMDGSKRSSRANAFFSGIGRQKKIILFDTLIEKHTVEELVAVLAHEVGHYKKRHILQGMLLAVLQTGLWLFLLSWFVFTPELTYALGGSIPSFHMGLVAFGILISPIQAVVGFFTGLFSRHNEYEADRFAALTFSGPMLAASLKRLSVDHLSNLQPHPLYVLFHYSHPPVLERIRRLEEFAD